MGKRTTHCPRGHEYTEENTGYYGTRLNKVCIQCERDRATETRDEKKLLTTYRLMKDRCYNANAPDYHNYGGRGITVDDRWLGEDGYLNFTLDMGERPEGTTLDRVDNDGPYSPENCRWSAKRVQQLNRRMKRGRSGFIGVRMVGDKGQARIKINQEEYSLGTYSSPEKAACVFDDVSLIVNGRDANLNYPTRIAGSGEPIPENQGGINSTLIWTVPP